MTRTEAERFAVAMQTSAVGTPDGTLVVPLRQALALLRLVVPEFDFVLTEEKVSDGRQVASNLGFPRPVDRPDGSS